ncbi:hypothetical protein BraRD5C2_58430 [Bradyrhizobium sp. RD5-C2]|nr:hypothetical protein BraRD5C2_58430 [Bradyrhizobium sp. RD5-C2]
MTADSAGDLDLSAAIPDNHGRTRGDGNTLIFFNQIDHILRTADRHGTRKYVRKEVRTLSQSD